MTNKLPPAKGEQERTVLQKAQDRLVQVAASISPFSALIPYTFPKFDDLPKVPGQPQGCLWGFFDKDGKKDEHGTSREIQTGRRVQLDRVFDPDMVASFGRKKFEHKILDASKTRPDVLVFDDEVSFNTQSSSQWDSLKHVRVTIGLADGQFAHQKARRFYNDVTLEDARSTPVNGSHNLSVNGGIASRGVLVDWLDWYEKTKGQPPSPVQRHEIPISQIIETLKHQNTTTRPGDILVVRTGLGRWLDTVTRDEQSMMRKNRQYLGVQANDETVRWLYDQHFAAVAGDAIAFEAYPPQGDKLSLHEWLLSQWGTPIGELWDLEKLSAQCLEIKRWTFFLTSAPLRVIGGVGSPPNVIAIL